MRRSFVSQAKVACHAPTTFERARVLRIRSHTVHEIISYTKEHEIRGLVQSPITTMRRRTFLQLFGSSIGLVASERLVTSRGQRATKSNVPVVGTKILVAHR